MNKSSIAVSITALLLAACATTIRSDVTVFQEWPAQLQDQSYVFEAPLPAEQSLEYRNYQNVLRSTLAGLKFTEAASASAARLTVALHFSTIDHALRVFEASDPFWQMRQFDSAQLRYYHGPWAYSSVGGPFFYPYDDPFPYGPLELRETIRHSYERQLQVSINDMSGKQLFHASVQNSSPIASTAAVMPALIASAFANFPGQSGVPQQVVLKLK